MLANDNRSDITATEVAERHEEKLPGPRTGAGAPAQRAAVPADRHRVQLRSEGRHPPGAPAGIQGVELDVEFISVLAQAQRAVATQGMDRLLGTIRATGAVKPEVLDKIDFDQVVDDYQRLRRQPGDHRPRRASGCNPAATRPTLQAQQAAAAAPVAVESAKTASEIDTGNLQDVLTSLQGYSQVSPAPTSV